VSQTTRNPRQRELIIQCEWPDLFLVLFLKKFFLSSYKVQVQTSRIKREKVQRYTECLVYFPFIVIVILFEFATTQVLSFLKDLKSLGRMSPKRSLNATDRMSLNSDFFKNFDLQGELSPKNDINIVISVEFISRFCGFHEIVSSNASTLVQIEFLKQNQGWRSLGLKFPTRLNYAKNFIAYIEATGSLIDEVMSISKLRNWQTQDFTSSHRRKGEFPEQFILQIIQIFKAFFWHLMSQVTHKEEYWSIAYISSNLKNAFSKDFILVPNPPERFFADPFLVKVQNANYIFVEDIDRRTGRGSISVLSLESNGEFRIDNCLVEDFHLSFPFIFLHEGSYYMIPETKEIHEIRVYICEQFPNKWSYYKTLMYGVSAVDNQIFYSEGLWWLVTGLSPLGHLGRMSDVVAFYSNDPLSTDWTPYDSLFIVRDSENGRNGGIYFSEGEIYRVGQRYGLNSYGDGLTLSLINRISPSHYAESMTLEVTYSHKSPISGIHSLASNEDVTVIDFKSKISPSKLEQIYFQINQTP
jgi:hypothetical protein